MVPDIHITAPRFSHGSPPDPVPAVVEARPQIATLSPVQCPTPPVTLETALSILTIGLSHSGERKGPRLCPRNGRCYASETEVGTLALDRPLGDRVFLMVDGLQGGVPLGFPLRLDWTACLGPLSAGSGELPPGHGRLVGQSIVS